MREKKVVAIAVATVVLLGAAWHAIAQDAKGPYPSMAPLDQYLMEDRGSEIALARSAAPESISRDAEVLVLGRHGYETAIKGTNGFVCMVERSWTAPIDDPGFWNPKGRAPTCLNAAAARSYLPRTIKKTDLILAGRTKAQMVEAISRSRQKGIAADGLRGHVLHAVKAGLLERPRRTLASPPDVFLFTKRSRRVGSGPAGFPHIRL